MWYEKLLLEKLLVIVIRLLIGNLYGREEFVNSKVLMILVCFFYGVLLESFSSSIFLCFF